MNEHNRRRDDPTDSLYGMFWVVGILIAMVLLASVLLGGCTTTGLSQEQQAAVAMKGCYTRAVQCRTITTASGEAGIAAAKAAEARQTEVNRRSK